MGIKKHQALDKATITQLEQMQQINTRTHVIYQISLNKCNSSSNLHIVILLNINITEQSKVSSLCVMIDVKYLWIINIFYISR